MSGDMTPAQKAGFEVGDRGEIIDEENSVFSVGSVVELYKDDRTTFPLWRLIEGGCGPNLCPNLCDGEPGAWASLDWVRKLPGEHATQPRYNTANHLITPILNDARRGYRPGAEEVRELLANNGETQKQAAHRIGVDPRTMRRAVTDSDPHRLNAHAWALLIISYLTGGDTQ